MKRIGVITYYKSLNYGAFLQCYALQKILKENNNSSVIDYISTEDLLKYKLISTKSIKTTIKSIILLPINIKRKHNFSKAQKKLHLSNTDDPHDIIIVGSDQVWNPNLNGGKLDKMYTLERIDAPKKISYAVSVGDDSVIDENEEEFKEIIRRLDHTSVREESTRKAISKITKSNISTAADPTILITRGEWLKEISNIKQDKNKYIFSYFINIDDDQKKLLARICEKTKLKTLSYSDIPKEKYIYKHTYADGPFQFLARLRDANLVITSSFHGTILAIILRKNFYVLSPKKQRGRLDNILNITGLSDRIIETEADMEKINLNDIDYTEPQKKLDKLRKESLDWLKNAIEN